VRRRGQTRWLLRRFLDLGSGEGGSRTRRRSARAPSKGEHGIACAPILAHPNNTNRSARPRRAAPDAIETRRSNCSARKCASATASDASLRERGLFSGTCTRCAGSRIHSAMKGEMAMKTRAGGRGSRLRSHHQGRAKRAAGAQRVSAGAETDGQGGDGRGLTARRATKHDMKRHRTDLEQKPDGLIAAKPRQKRAPHASRVENSERLPS